VRVVAAAVAALFLLAAPALGDVVYVPESPAGTDISSYAVGADTIYIANQNYTSTLTPPSAGTEERPKVWIGQGAGATFAAIVPKSHNRFYNLTSTAGVDFPSDGKHVMFDGCTIVGSLNMKDADSSSVRNCTIRGTSFNVATVAGSGLMADADTLDGCTFTGLSARTDFAIRFGFRDGSGADSCRYFVQRFNTFNISQSGNAAWTFSKHFYSPNFTSYANTYNLTSTATGFGDNEGDYCVLFRDCSYNLRMKRDVILVNNEGSTQSHRAFMFADGNNNPETNQNSTVDSCYIRVFRGSGIYLKTPMPSLKIRNCVVRSRLGTALDMATGYQAAAGDPYIHHNTFMGKQAVYFSEYANNGGGVSNNILWGTSTAPCDAYQAVGGTTGNLTAISDSNLVFSTTQDASRALCKTSCAPPAAGPWATTFSNDTHSYWADPQFADTSWFNLNVTPSAGITASSVFTLRYVGASTWPGGDDPWGPPAARKRPAYWGTDGD